LDASSGNLIQVAGALQQNHTRPGMGYNADDTLSVDCAGVQRGKRRVSIHQSDTKGIRPQKHRAVPVANQKRFELWLVRVIQDANVHGF
jgi:hypothetical protein